MHEKKTFAVAQVKAAESENPNGEFEIVMSTAAVDRDGESIVKGAFNPLPDSIPVHAFHDFNDPIGRAVPTYNGKGQLVGRGFFASTARAQEIRQLVVDGVIGHTSVGFMAADRKSSEGTPEIASAELLEVSFVSVPSNREAAVLAVKSGARNSVKDSERLQTIHDLSVDNGAACAGVAKAAVQRLATKEPTADVVQALDALVLAVYGEDAAIVEYGDDAVVVQVGEDFWRLTYTADGEILLTGEPIAVRPVTTYEPAEAPTDTPAAPATPAEDASAGKSPASDVVDSPNATRVEAFLLGLG